MLPSDEEMAAEQRAPATLPAPASARALGAAEGAEGSRKGGGPGSEPAPAEGAHDTHDVGVAAFRKRKAHAPEHRVPRQSEAVILRFAMTTQVPASTKVRNGVMVAVECRRARAHA